MTFALLKVEAIIRPFALDELKERLTALESKVEQLTALESKVEQLTAKVAALAQLAPLPAEANAPAPTASGTPEDAAAVLQELPRLCRAVRAATGADGVTVQHNCGAAGGQVVFHAHIHVLPRFEGDGLVKMKPHGTGGGGMIDKDTAEDVQMRL